MESLNIYYYNGENYSSKEKITDTWKLLIDIITDRLKDAKFKYGLNIVFLEAINRNTFSKLFIFSAKEDTFPYRPFPTLFFCVDSIDDQNNHERLGIPRTFRFLDDSIWCNYICISSSNWSEILDNKIKKIKSNYEKGLYDKNISLEYIELHDRLVKNSIIRDMDGHGAHISPFLFHSETKMEQLRKDKINHYSGLFNEKLKWRILLVDDYAEKALKGKNDKTSNLSTKKDILEYCIKSLGIPNINDKNFLIDTAIDLKEAEEKIQKIGYDIILLDYLLGDSKKKHRREYSYELLEKIADTQALEQKELYDEIRENRPAGKFYFMYISAFSTAVRERLQEQGLGYSNEYWHLGGGACPTNTPELFKYNFTLLLIRQLKQLSESVKDEKQRIFTLTELVSRIYVENDLNTTRVNADKYFNAVLLLRKKYTDLQEFCDKKKCKDALKVNDLSENECKNMCISIGDCNTVCKCTPLIYTLFPDLRNYNPAFWEHLMHLVYLTAYGTIRQWPEMWEEYLFIKSEFKNAECDVKDKKVKLTDCIEKHIINLKNNSF